MPTWNMKQNDRKPVLQATLTAGGNIVDLTAAFAVTFTMVNSAGTPKVSDGACAVASPATNGVVTYTWGSTDTNTSGTFLAEFEVTWNDGTLERFPNDSNFQVVVTPALG